jgi:hypothetical protein
MRDEETWKIGLTIEAMAKRIGTTRSTYWHREQDNRQMPAVFGERIREELKNQQRKMRQDHGASA